MFIRKNNTIKWNWIGWGALITFALVLIGVFGGDKLLYSLIHNTDCNQWNYGVSALCSISIIMGKIFSAKAWFVVSALTILFFFIYKAVKNEYDFRYAFVTIKNSYVFYVFCSIVLAIATTGIFKFLIGRSRPIMYEALNKTIFIPGTTENAFNSMPSGHTAVSFAALVMIGMLFPKAKWATWTLAIIIGLSRLYVGAHWATDVIVGAFIGMVCADLVKAGLKKINSK